MALPISVMIVAKNEEKQIEECIKSVYGWAGEILVFDHDSQDKTVAIASRYTDKIFRRETKIKQAEKGE